jgi:hypothetical protein
VQKFSSDGSRNFRADFGQERVERIIMKKHPELEIKAVAAQTLLWLGLGLASGGWAAELYVPAQYSTIQAAVNEAASGDTIRIAAGDYYEQIVIADKTDLATRWSSKPPPTCPRTWRTGSPSTPTPWSCQSLNTRTRTGLAHRIGSTARCGHEIFARVSGRRVSALNCVCAGARRFDLAGRTR